VYVWCVTFLRFTFFSVDGESLEIIVEYDAVWSLCVLGEVVCESEDSDKLQCAYSSAIFTATTYF